MTAILPRSAWTSTPNARRTPLAVTGVVWFVPHWPATPGVIGVESRAETAARLRGWRAHHIKGNGWRDIGYNYAVDQAGRIWNLTGDHVGAHAGPQVNPRGLGVLCVLGMGEEPTAAMLDGLRSLYALKRRKFHRMETVAGHGQTPGNSTECPGGPMRRVIAAGQITSKTPPRKDWFDMATEAQLRKIVSEETDKVINRNHRIGELWGSFRKGSKGRWRTGDLRDKIERNDKRVIEVTHLARALAESDDPAAIAAELSEALGKDHAKAVARALLDELSA